MDTHKSELNRQFFGPRDLEILPITSKNNRPPLPCHFKLLSLMNSNWSCGAEMRKLGHNLFWTTVALIFDFDLLNGHHLCQSLWPLGIWWGCSERNRRKVTIYPQNKICVVSYVYEPTLDHACKWCNDPWSIIQTWQWSIYLRVT